MVSAGKLTGTAKIPMLRQVIDNRFSMVLHWQCFWIQKLQTELAEDWLLSAFWISESFLETVMTSFASFSCSALTLSWNCFNDFSYNNWASRSASWVDRTTFSERPPKFRLFRSLLNSFRRWGSPKMLGNADGGVVMCIVCWIRGLGRPKTSLWRETPALALHLGSLGMSIDGWWVVELLAEINFSIRVNLFTPSPFNVGASSIPLELRSLTRFTSPLSVFILFASCESTTVTNRHIARTSRQIRGQSSPSEKNWQQQSSSLQQPAILLMTCKKCRDAAPPHQSRATSFLSKFANSNIDNWVFVVCYFTIISVVIVWKDAAFRLSFDNGYVCNTFCFHDFCVTLTTPMIPTGCCRRSIILRKDMIKCFHRCVTPTFPIKIVEKTNIK